MFTSGHCRPGHPPHQAAVCPVRRAAAEREPPGAAPLLTGWPPEHLQEDICQQQQQHPSEVSSQESQANSWKHLAAAVGAGAPFGGHSDVAVG
jgi:hypothetical protein